MTPRGTHIHLEHWFADAGASRCRCGQWPSRSNMQVPRSWSFSLAPAASCRVVMPLSRHTPHRSYCNPSHVARRTGCKGPSPSSLCTVPICACPGSFQAPQTQAPQATCYAPAHQPADSRQPRDGLREAGAEAATAVHTSRVEERAKRLKVGTPLRRQPATARSCLQTPSAPLLSLAALVRAERGSRGAEQSNAYA